MPPKEELWRPFENVVETKQKRRREVQRLTWRLFDNRVYLRGIEQDESFVYVVAPPRYTFVDSRWPEKSIEKWLTEYFQWEAVQRVVNVPQEGQIPWIHIYRDGKLAVSLSNWQRGLWSCSFISQEEKVKWFHSPFESVQRDLCRCVQSDLDEWKKAKQWAEWDNEARFWSLISWERGGSQEWCDLAKAALQIGLVRRERPETISWPMFLLYEPRFPQAPLQIQKSTFWPPVPVLTLMEIAQRHFGARVNYGRLRIPPSETLVPPRITSSKPSQHELMEALDLWREFGRQSGQLARVEELLRQLLT